MHLQSYRFFVCFSRPSNSKATHHKEWLTQDMSGVEDTVLQISKQFSAIAEFLWITFPKAHCPLIHSPDEEHA